jgi:hypothetical protein
VEEVESGSEEEKKQTPVNSRDDLWRCSNRIIKGMEMGGGDYIEFTQNKTSDKRKRDKQRNIGWGGVRGGKRGGGGGGVKEKEMKTGTGKAPPWAETLRHCRRAAGR